MNEVERKEYQDILDRALVQETVDKVIATIKDHCGRWRKMELDALGDGDYHGAQSYSDMAYAGEALVNEIERKMYMEETA